MCGKRFALCLVLSLLLLSPTLSAEVCLTDDEFQELTTIFETLENTLATQSLELQTLQTQLATAETRLAESQNSIAMLKQTSIELKNSFDALKKEQTVKVVKTAIVASLISAVIGFIIGVSLTL
jgi:septal ring factor EnvC (AmiA/AmiB activator)